MPAWFIDGEITGQVTRSGMEASVAAQSLNSYMPGISSDPLSTLSFSQPKLEELAVPFTSELRHQHGLKISCQPYLKSPVHLLKVVKSSTSFKLSDLPEFDHRRVKFLMLAAYPVLLPVYLLRYDWRIPAVPEKGLVYLDTRTKAAGGLLRKTLSVPPGSLTHKFSHAVDHMPIWDLIYGKYDVINKTASYLVDKKIRSKSDMAALAKYRVDMDHPCVRAYTKEEVDANRKFLAASSDCYPLYQSRSKQGMKEVVDIITKFQATGNPVIRPETFNKFLKGLRLGKEMTERILAAEKQRDDLKPQWVRTWQNSAKT